MVGVLIGSICCIGGGGVPPGVDAELLNEALFRKLAERVEEPLRAKAGGALAAILG